MALQAYLPALRGAWHKTKEESIKDKDKDAQAAYDQAS